MKIKQLILLTLATLCCSMAYAVRKVKVQYQDSIVMGQLYLFQDKLVTPGEYTDTISVGLTDSIITLKLKYFTPCEDIEVTIADSIVEGEKYLFIDTFLTSEGTYTRTLQRAGCGCDSTINLTLSYFTPCRDIEVAVADSIIEGEKYLFIDTLLTSEGTYTRTLQRAGCGCDSTINLTLKLLPACEDTIVAYTDSIFVGESYLFIDTLISRPAPDTTTYQRIISRQGCTCDSIINLTLIAMRVPVRDTLYETTAVDRCYKEAFTDRLGVTYRAANDTTIQDTILNARVELTDTFFVTIDSIYVYNLTVWPATEYPTALKDTIDEDRLPYEWRPYEGVLNQIYVAGTFYDTVTNIRDCDSIIYELDLVVRTVERREAEPVNANVCAGTEYVGRLTTHTINGLTEWYDSLRVWDNVNLIAIDSIYTYTIDTLITFVPEDILYGFEVLCNYPVHYAEPKAALEEYLGSIADFAIVESTLWEVETAAGWQPIETVITENEQSVRFRVTLTTECGVYSYLAPRIYGVNIAQADDEPELNVPSAKKYGNRIVMVDKNATEALGWVLNEKDVVWYQVVGEIDKRNYSSSSFEWDDKVVKEGSFYFTNMDGAPLEGDFYAIIPSEKDAFTCGVELRTNVLNCVPENKAVVRIAPNMVTPNETMELTGLDANSTYTVRVIGTNGQTEQTLKVEAQEAITLKAAALPGMYLVNVMGENENVSLKYIVK